ncbi:hypothetical protein AVEN_123909-1 [Araneus ventricosus]|uniref:Uncharacterized protein n=1 Tax=Araneus ventricosus TaxID=182803 RepID=A0A4Y2S8E9_ARAVE|nr:hypothetical protein AVEN_213977-1 [Araneus ventricosus]GBN84330.1 hypothetical protein AVEN_123909-1 [Araneus ventricosus]
MMSRLQPNITYLLTPLNRQKSRLQIQFLCPERRTYLRFATRPITATFSRWLSPYLQSYRTGRYNRIVCNTQWPLLTNNPLIKILKVNRKSEKFPDGELLFLRARETQGLVHRAFSEEPVGGNL